mgnify:CR=1 FL=1
MTKEERRVIDAAMRLWNSRASYLQNTPHGMDCQGEYWIIRNNAPMREYRRACDALAASRRKERK